MSENRSPIPSRLYNAAKGGHVAGTADIIDDDKGKTQDVINKETDERITTEVGRAENVEGNLNTRLQTVEQLAEISVGGGDIGIGTAADFESDDPEDLAKVPTIGAVLGSMDDEPTAESGNLVKSGGAFNQTFPLQNALSDYEDITSQITIEKYSDGYIPTDANNATIQSSTYYEVTKCFSALKGDVIKWNSGGNAICALAICSDAEQDANTKYTSLVNCPASTLAQDFEYTIEKDCYIVLCGYKEGIATGVNGIILQSYERRGELIQVKEIKNQINSLPIPQIPYIGYFANGTASVDSNRVLSISNFDLYSNKRSFDRISGTKTVQLANGSDVIWFDLTTKEFSVSTNYNKNSVLVGVCYGYYENVILNGIKCVDFQNKLEYDILDKNAAKQLSLLADVPQEIIDSAIDAKGRIDTWRGSNEVVLCGQVTDLHANRNIDVCKALEQLTAINTFLNCDVLVNAGDIGIERANSDYIASVLLSRSIKYMDSSLVWLFCKGNHDYRTSINQLSLANALNMPIVCNHDIGYNRDNGDVSYGYFDQTRLKVRFIYINTSEGDTNDYTMSQTQIEWIITALQGAASDYGIVVLSHMCIDAIGRWNSYPDDASADCFVVLRNVFKDFVAKTSGSGTINGNTVSWDFTSAQGSLVCVLSGDSHFDNYIKRDGVNYIVRQGYGTVSSSELPQGAVYQDENIWLNKYKKCCFDILAVNKGGGAKIFRIGIGGADRDLAFTY